MRRINWMAGFGALIMLILVGSAYALSSYLTSFNTRYGTAGTALNTCSLCHPAGGGNNAGNLNNFALDFAANGHSFVAIENLDSDGDGFTNIVEINARTFPGNAASFPSVDSTAPIVTAFTIPSTSASLTVLITTFTATDAVGVTGYLLTETAAAPAAGAAGWTTTAPASYTFAAAGTKSLYAWAKDAAGNVSTSLSASVVITLSPGGDTTAPTVTAFTIPATSASLTVPITTFTATDAVGVTGYLLTETATAPAAGAAGWTATVPASYTFATAGAKTLYAWAKDAAGNVSTFLSDSVVITLVPGTDTTAPTVTAFAIPAASASLAVPITTFTAADGVGVTGYLLTETATAPAAGAAGWTATAPTSYTFATAGAKTLYAWAKDAAGNVSTSLSASVVITLSLSAPTNLAPASGSTNVALSPTLQISATFPDPTGSTHISTNWQVASDAAFAGTSVVFSSMNNTAKLISLSLPPGVLLPARTYYWRAATTNSAGQTSPYSTVTSFTTLAVTMDVLTGTVPDTLAVKSGGTQVTNLSSLSPAQLAAAGNISVQLVSGPNSFPVVNAGTATDVTRAGMMIVRADGGVSQNVLGIVTPAGTSIESVSTATTANSSFMGAQLPAGISFPYGVVSFRIGGVTPGASIAVTVYTPSDLPSGAIWCKYSPSQGWLKIDAAGVYDRSGTLLSTDTKFSVVGGRGVLTIKDDGSTDYSAELVTGKAVILDPGGPGTPAIGEPIAGDGGESGCFIATAAFGSPINPYVRILKEIRNKYLLTSAGGRKFVDAYYRISPQIAAQIEASPLLRVVVQIMLLPLIGFSFLALQIDLAAAVLLLGCVGAFGRWYYKRRRRILSPAD